jgi:hypothetical protein
MSKIKFRRYLQYKDEAGNVQVLRGGEVYDFEDKYLFKFHPHDYEILERDRTVTKPEPESTKPITTEDIFKKKKKK